jgi:hypothetical protein
MRHIFNLFALCASLLASNAIAQPNILGLPAVPQTPIQSATPPTDGAAAKTSKPGASGARASTTVKPAAAAPQETVNDVEAKSVLSGGVTMASSYEGKVATVRVTTNNVYQGEVYRGQAIKAAKLVQRDLVTSCAWQCKPAPMPAPVILDSGKLQFVMAIDNYPRVLSYDDMITMLLGKPLAVMPKAAVTATAAPATAAAAPRPTAAPATNALPAGVVRSSNLDPATPAGPAQ